MHTPHTHTHTRTHLFPLLQVFVTKSYDATTHFETTCSDVIEIYEKVMGEPFDFSKVKTQQEEDH